MAESTFGWDLLYRSVKSEIKCDEDLLLCFTHFVLITNQFKCIGIGESKTFDGEETESEALPSSWNDVYALRYKYLGRLYNLKCTKLDDGGVMINLIRVDERTVSMVQLNINSIAQRDGSLNQIFPNHKDLFDSIKQQLINKVITSKKNKDASQQTEQINQPQRSYDYPQPDFIPPPPAAAPFSSNFPESIGVGERDLHPFGRFRHPGSPLGPNIGGIGGGGMLFDPPRGGRIGPNFPGVGPNFGVPPGSVPPGARFDPFRPPETDRYRRPPNRPDNDEFPPPGYDDMFM